MPNKRLYRISALLYALLFDFPNNRATAKPHRPTYVALVIA